MHKLLKALWFMVRKAAVLCTALVMLGIPAAMAQGIGAPPGPFAGPPPGLGGVPPCTLNFLPEQANVPCVAITLFSEELSTDERAAIVQGAGAVLRFNFQLVNAAAVLVPDIDSLGVLASDPRLVLTPDRPIHAIGKPDGKPGGGKGGGGGKGDSGQVTPSGVVRIGADPKTNTGEGVGVAIVDTGLDFTHTDLNVSRYCFDAFERGCQDENGHGTHVGGIVAARNNTSDVIGVAPGATLYAVKVLDSTGAGSDSTVILGLDWVWVESKAGGLNPPIRVVNMSLGRPGTLGDSPALRASIQALTNDPNDPDSPGLGISVVVAAGNDPSKEVYEQVPATYPEVMAVASTTAVKGQNKCKRFTGFIEADTASYFTTDGAFFTPNGELARNGIGVTISAPGEQKEDISRGCFVSSVGILSLKLGGGTTRMSGTSMAAPHVAGVVALMIELEEPLDPEEARLAIQGTADLIGTAPLDSPTTSYFFDGEREGIVQAPAPEIIQ